LTTKKRIVAAAALAIGVVGHALPTLARAGMTYGETVPAMAVGQSWVYDATAKYADIDGLQLVFMFTTTVGQTVRIDTMPYNMTKPEDDTVFRQIGVNTVIDDDGGQNNYSSAIWRRTVASTSVATIENYGFDIKGFSVPLRNLRVIVTRLK
jgi:hypothetical protein